MIAPIAEAYEEAGLWLPLGHDAREPEAYLYEDGSTWRHGFGWNPDWGDWSYSPEYWSGVIARNAAVARGRDAPFSLAELYALLGVKQPA